MPKKQADGRYRGKVVVNGEAHYFSARTLAEFNRERERTKAYWRDGVRPDDVEWSQAVAEWYETYKRPRISIGSQVNYQIAINKHVIPAFEGRMLRAIRRAEIQTFVDSFAGSSSSHIGYVMTVVKNVFHQAYADGVIEKDPADALIRPQAKPPRKKGYLTDDQTAHYLSVASAHPYGHVMYGLYYTGARIGELLALRWEDIDFKTNQIHITKDIDFRDGGKIGSLKTESAEREVPILPEYRDMLMARRGLPGAYVYFTKDPFRPITPNEHELAWKSVKQALGPDLDITPHWLRHNFVSLCVAAGIPAEVTMRLVGHAKYATTIDVYTHIKNQMMNDAGAALEGAFKKRVAGKLPEANRGSDII